MYWIIIVFILANLAWLVHMEGKAKDLQTITIHNMCGVLRVTGGPLDLYALSYKMWNCSYNPKRLNAVVIRKTRPRATVLVFKSGNVLILGTQDVRSLEKVGFHLEKELQKILLIKSLKCSPARITNIMAGGDLGKILLT